jgi:hypothetical protein
MRKGSHATRHIVIMQPYFLPYRNYYGLIRRCDEFVIFDDVQFGRKWQQRNSIPADSGRKQWLTIPVLSRRPLLQKICDVELAPGLQWRRDMLRRIARVYCAHRHFDEVFTDLSRILLMNHVRLVDLNVALLQWSASAIGLPAPVWRWSSQMATASDDRSRRLIKMCQALGATHYVCGPAAKIYLREDWFASAGIDVIWHEEMYPPYPQAAMPQFDHFVSILDLLMNHGTASRQYLEPYSET